MNNSDVRIVLYGIPVPQGSKVSYGPRRMVDANAAKLKPWREAVKQAAVAQMGERLPLEGPCAVIATFYLPRPQSAPKRVLWPAKKPDLDKLLRAALDGFTDAGVFGDDAQVVDVRARKRFAADPHDPHALPRPGMSARIEVLP